MAYWRGSLRHVILRRDDVINELGKRERDAALLACLSNIHQIHLGPISTETVNSTVKVACEGLKAGHPPELGRHCRLTRHGIFLFILGQGTCDARDARQIGVVASFRFTIHGRRQTAQFWEGERQGRSNEAVRCRRASDRPSGLPARYALTPFSRRLIRRALLLPASHSNPVPVRGASHVAVRFPGRGGEYTLDQFHN